MNRAAPERQETAIAAEEFIEDVRRGLGGNGQKALPAKYLYDDVGSALFEVITQLPEYGLTRADDRLIEAHAADLAEMLQPGALVAELGSGSGTKTRRILTRLAALEATDYFPIDISAAALERCQSELHDIPGLRVSPIASGYLDGLREAVRSARGRQCIVLFLGSTIGNFDRSVARRFLADLRRGLRQGDVLLMGTDLEKPIAQLLGAYDDPIGVTAAFNRNVLARINRELGGEFDPKAFAHEVRYDEGQRRIEMHLRSLRDQEVRIRAADLRIRLEENETIWTESSHKFDCQEIRRMATACGFHCTIQWVDEEWPFAENVLTAE